MEKRYKIREFSEMIGVTPSTLRNWDRSGLLKSNRTISNQRYYTDEHIRKIEEMEREKLDAAETNRLERMQQEEMQ